MGNTASHQALSHFNEDFNLEEYTKIQQCFVESLGEIHELTNPLNKATVFLKIIKIEQEVIPKEIEILNQKFSVLHPNLLKTYGSTFSYKNSKGEVSTDAMIYFEVPVKSLHDEIFFRKQTREPFPAMELLVYLKNCIDAFALLEEKGCVYEHITPRTIFFSQNNQIKTAHPTLLGLIDFAESLRFETNKEIKRLMCLEITKHLGFTRRSLKGSVFTLGVTFLASALLEEENMLYQSPNDPQSEKFRAYNHRLRNSYPSDFVNILRHMLDDDEAKRPSFIQLRDNIVEYMKSDALDTQFPMSPTFPTGKKNRIPFTESFPSNVSKGSFSNPNTLGSPQNELTNNIALPEWSFKPNPNSKSFLDKLFCGFCSTNQEEEIEIKQPMMSRPTRKQTVPEAVAGNVDRNRESLQFNSEIFEGLVKETSQQQKTIPTVLTTDPHERIDDSMYQAKLTPPGHDNNESIQIIEYHSHSQGNISKWHLPEKRLERQSISSPEKNESPKKVGLPEIKGIANVQSADKGGLRTQTSRRKLNTSSTQTGRYQENNTLYGSMSSQRQKSQIQTMTQSKKSKLVKQIINDYKRGGMSQTKSKNNTARMPLEEIKVNDFSRFLESNDKHRPVINKSSYDELFGSTEKSKINTLSYSYREAKDMTRKNNEDGEGIFIEPEASIYGINSRTRNKKSIGHSPHLSNSPYRDGEGSYRSGDMVVMNNECPACHTQYISVNKSFTYSISTERANREDKEETLRSLSHRKGSVKWNLGNELGLNYSSPDNNRGQERHREGCGYHVMVTPARQEPVRTLGLSSI